MQKYLAVLLTVHNRREKTLKSLENLYGQNLPEGVCMNVYMTDDGCTDGTREAVEERFHQVVIVPGDGSLYWNMGMRQAWEAASKDRSYDWYLWLNDDTYLLPGALEQILNDSISLFQESHIIVGATKSEINGMLTYGGHLADGTIPDCESRLQPVDYFNGNIVLVSAAAFGIVGNLNPHFRHSKGDFDYGWRAKKEGVHIYQCGEVLGFCERHEKIDKWCDPDVPFAQRWRAMLRPTGMPPSESFYLDASHGRYFSGCIHYLSTILRCVFPSLWLKK